jgi:hypothetical protein
MTCPALFHFPLMYYVAQWLDRVEVNKDLGSFFERCILGQEPCRILG